jgi:hypothetical protein
VICGLLEQGVHFEDLKYERVGARKLQNVSAFDGTQKETNETFRTLLDVQPTFRQLNVCGLSVVSVTVLPLHQCHNTGHTNRMATKCDRKQQPSQNISFLFPVAD